MAKSNQQRSSIYNDNNHNKKAFDFDFVSPFGIPFSIFDLALPFIFLYLHC
jgi:hypothetical protein